MLLVAGGGPDAPGMGVPSQQESLSKWGLSFERHWKLTPRRKATSNTTATMGSAWSPLARRVFRALWIAALASNVGTLMQSVAAAWLMTSLTPSPLPVALLTTAGSLPLFLVGLPAGALADLIDRRRLVLLTQLWMLAVAVVLGALALIGWMAPWSLLGLTFLLGLGSALSAPAWQAIIPQLVEKEELAAAVALNGAGFNLARAVGPAVGGLLVAGIGPGGVFLLNAASFLGVIAVIYRWQPEPHSHASTTPPESVRSAVAAGLRYARHSPQLRAAQVRTAAFVLPASALWALLPVVAQRELGLTAVGYGILLGSLGIGAVGGAAILPRLRERMSIDRLVIAMTLIFAGGTFGLAYLRNPWLLNPVLMAVGMAWLTITSSLNVSTQTTAPSWVQARAVGVYLLVFQGGFAGGSAVWGFVAGRYGLGTALLAAAAVMALGIATALRWHLVTGEELDLSPSQHWPEPEFALEPDPESGPVLITVEYRVDDEHHDAFCQAMEELQTIRRRDGAARWGLFRDPAAPDRYLETFVVTSWGEHLRQHERITVTDREVEERALALQRPATSPVVSHFIATGCSTSVAAGP